MHHLLENRKRKNKPKPNPRFIQFCTQSSLSGENNPRFGQNANYLPLRKILPTC
jgi:hypothetical protein